jgi:hypothetical protein
VLFVCTITPGLAAHQTLQAEGAWQKVHCCGSCMKNATRYKVIKIQSSGKA